MTAPTPSSDDRPADPAAAAPGPTTGPLVVEDILLLLFQPKHQAILGEDILYYVLGGAVITDLALGGWIEIDEPSRWGGRRVRATGEQAPDADILRPAWEKIAEKPRDVQTVLAESGPLLRQPVIDRLVASGDLRSTKKKTLGLFETTTLSEGDTGRRAALVAEVRAVLVDGAPPTPRLAALVGLLSASGELVNLNDEIPWSGPVAERAFALQYGTVEGSAAGLAVLRTDVATYVTPVVLAIAAGR